MLPGGTFRDGERDKGRHREDEPEGMKSGGWCLGQEPLLKQGDDGRSSRKGEITAAAGSQTERDRAKGCTVTKPDAVFGRAKDCTVTKA